MRCARWPQCYVMALIRGGVFSISPNSPEHNHPPMPNLQVIAEFERRLFFMTTHQWISLRQTYNSVMAEFPGIVVPYHDIQQRMANWRRNFVPPEVQTYADIQRVLQTPDWHTLLRYDRGVMRMNDITAADGVTAAVWGDPAFAEDVPNADTELYIGIDTLTRPNIAGTIGILSVAILRANRAFTIAWGLLNEVTPEICAEVINWCRTQLFPELTPEQIITNFDWRMQRALNSAWDDGVHFAPPIVTTFHELCLSVLHQADEIRDLSLENEDHLKILRKLITLCWLPADLIPEMFLWLQQSIELGGLAEVFQPLLNWFSENLIRGITPLRLSHHNRYELFDAATYDVPWNTRNKTARNRPEIDLWPFFHKTLEIATNSVNDMERVRRGQPYVNNISTSPRVSTSISRRSLRLLWQELQDNVISPRRFLTIAANVVTPFLRLLIHQRNFIGLPFEPVQPNEPVANAILEQQFIGPVPEPNNQLLLAEINFDDLGIMLVEGDPIVGGENEDVNEDEAAAAEPLQAVNVEENDEVQPLPFANFYDWRCVRCRDRRIRMVSRPCNCIATCYECERDIRQEAAANGALQCPRCNQRVITFERVYIVENGNERSPYDWQCQICDEQPIDMMAQQCRQVMLCHRCAQRVNDEDERNRRALKCSFCNGPGNMQRVVNLRQSFDNAVGNSRDRAFALDTTSAMIQTLILCKRNDDAPYLSASTEVSAKYKGAFCEIKICKVVRSVQRRVMYKQGLGTATGIGDPIKRTIRIGPSVEARRTDKKEFVEAAITKIQVCSLYTIVFDDGHITALSRTALCLKSGLVAAATVHDTVRIRVEEDYLVMLFKDAKYYTVWKRERTEFTKMLGLKVENPEKDKFSPKYNTQSLPEEEETPLVLSSSSPSSSAAEDPSKQIMKDEEAPGERSSICNLKSDVNIEAKSTTESSSFKKLQITPFMPVLSNRKLPKPVKEEPTKKSVRKKQKNSSSSSSTFFQSSTSTAPGEKQKSGEENPTKAWSKSKEDKESRKMRACSKHRMTEDDVKIQQRGREKGEENEKIREKDESSGAEWASCYKGSIQLGDRLKVLYYGQTHESKVTLGAKVIGLQRVEEGAQFDYLLHYRSWNTRYDEWTKVTRIAPNFPLTQRCMKRTVTKPQPQTPSATASAEALNRIKEPVDQPKLTTTEKKKEESARGVIKPKKEEDDQKIGRGVDLMTTNAKFLERRSNEKLQIDPLKKISESNDLDKQTWKKILSQEFLDFTDSSDSEQKLVINNPKEKCDEEIKVEEPESSTFDIKVMDESAGRSMGEEKLEKKIVILKMPFAYAPTSGAQSTSQGELPMKVASSCEVQGAIGHGMLQPVVWQREAQIKVVVGGMQMINQNGQECNEAALVMDNTPLTTPDSTISNVSVSPREEKTRKSPTSKNNGKTKGVESHFEEGLAETLGMGEKGEVKRPMKDSETPRKWNRKRTRSGSITRQEAGANHSDDTSEGSTERTSIGQMEKVVNGVGEMLGKDQKHLKYIFYMELNLKIDECQEIAVLQQQLFEKGLQPRKNRISCN